MFVIALKTSIPQITRINSRPSEIRCAVVNELHKAKSHKSRKIIRRLGRNERRKDLQNNWRSY